MRFTIILLLFITQLRFDLFSQDVILEQSRKTFYLHAPNPFKIYANKIKCDDLFINAKYGTITNEPQHGCEFYYWNDKCQIGGDRIIIYKIAKQDTIALDTLFITLSDEALESVLISIVFYRSYTGSISKYSVNKKDIRVITIDSTYYYPYLTANLINWDIELPYKIDRYSIDQIRDSTLIYSKKNIIGKNLTDELVKILQTSKINDQFRFYDIYLLFDSCERVFEGPSITIE